MRIYYRTVRNNRVRIRGKILTCANLTKGELDGKRFGFIPYDNRGDTGFSADGLTALWGTERASKEIYKISGGEALEESDRLLAPDGYFRWYWWKERETAPMQMASP